MISLCATPALCLTLQMSNHGAHLGEHFASRDPYHLDRWRAALHGRPRKAAMRRHRSIDRPALSRDPAQVLQQVPMPLPALRTHRGRREAPAVARASVAADRQRRRESERRGPHRADRTTPLALGVANRSNRRRARRSRSAPATFERVREWLRSVARVDDLDALTARCRDRLLWAGALCIARRTTEETALKSVANRAQG